MLLRHEARHCDDGEVVNLLGRDELARLLHGLLRGRAWGWG